MLALKDIVAKYLELAGEYGRPVPLAAFGWPREETERTFSALEEDYHIGRFLAFSREPSALSPQPSAAEAEFNISGFPQTHIRISPRVTEIL